MTSTIGRLPRDPSLSGFRFRPQEQAKFKGVIHGVTLEVKITPLDATTFAAAKTFEFKADGQGANLAGTANPVIVGLIIGDDGGSTTVKAELD